MFRTFLKQQSLINKMQLLNVVGITAAMFVVLLAFSMLWASFARRTMAEDLLTEARLLAINTAPMLVFHDNKETEKLAGTFKKVGGLLRVAVFDRNHQAVTDLTTTKTAYTPQPVRDRIKDLRSDAISFETDRLLVFVRIHSHDEYVGTVVMESSLDAIKKSLIWFVSIGAAATVLGVLFSVFILRKLQLWALSPIMNMSDLVEQVATNRDYHLRVSIDGRDEVARLAGRLNQMLERIEIWDKDLKDEINQRRESEKQLDSLSRTDMLTKLPNRLAFNNDLKKAIYDSQNNGEKMALLFIDLDDFKQVNDIHGHNSGDLVLQVTAKRFLHLLRDTDTLYRLGGDEFSVLLREITDESPAKICKRLISATGEEIGLDSGQKRISVRIGASVGLAFFPAHAQRPEDLVHRADLAMYAAKKNGKNSFVVFEKKMELEKEKT